MLMRIAIPQWQGRVSPVFDVAANLQLVEVDGAREVGRREVALTATDPARRAQQVAQLPADVLICGAISWPFEIALSSAGVRVIPRTCGEVEEVLQAFASGRLTDKAFLMPGCFLRGRSCQSGKGGVGGRHDAGERNGRGQRNRGRCRGGGRRRRGN